MTNSEEDLSRIPAEVFLELAAQSADKDGVPQVAARMRSIAAQITALRSSGTDLASWLSRIADTMPRDSEDRIRALAAVRSWEERRDDSIH